MSVRVLLAVVATVVLFALVAPAVEDARHARSDVEATRTLDRFVSASDRLVARNAPGAGAGTAPRRRIVVAAGFPGRLVLRNDSRVATVRVDGRRVARALLPVPLRVRNGTLTAASGDALVVSYERRGTPVLVVTREFIREPAATQWHAVAPHRPRSRYRPPHAARLFVPHHRD